MTPKEKSKELINKFTFAGIYFTDGDNGAKVNAKFCAELCVDEILKSFDSFMDQRRNFRHELEIDAERYWQEVKTEIQKL